MLDLGLSKDTIAWLKTYNGAFAVPGWDLPVSPERMHASPHLRALTARPFLPRYFPGYDLYIWMDPDTWIQRSDVFDWYITAAENGAMAITPQLDRAYRQHPQLLAWRHARLETYYGKDVADLLAHNLYFNIGVFALRADAPHWQSWAESFAAGLNASDGTLVCDQSAINQALWQGNLPVYPLPAICNWICHMGVPIYDGTTGLLHEPFIPHAPLGIIHMTADTKDATITYSDAQGQRWRRSLHYNAQPFHA